MAHILLDNAFSYCKRKDVAPSSEFYYDDIVGAWLTKDEKLPLVTHVSFPDRGTKKQDIETGEDQKGQ